MHTVHEILFFCGFILIIVIVLLTDLLFVGRRNHVISAREAAIWTGIWVFLAFLFYLVLLFYGDKLHSMSTMNDVRVLASKYAPHLNLKFSSYASALIMYRKNMATEFLTGYVVEYTLSLDNVFVILMILTGFAVPVKSYKTVLFWGIFGAILLRFIFIFLCGALVQKFQLTLTLFGVFLIYTSIRVFIERNKQESVKITDHPVVRFLSKWFSVYPGFIEEKFTYRVNNLFFITPLLIVLVVVEITDLIFAFDSIPAIFSVTRDPYIVFFSNIFAIIGLRSLFFLIIKIFYLFKYLKEGVSILLLFIGLKLVFHQWLDHIGFEPVYSLYVIIIIITVSIMWSIIEKRVMRSS